MNWRWWVRSVAPWIVTGAWIGLAGVVVCVRLETFIGLSLNEWGDFFAGVFAPVAVFWFILAYFLQKEEIQNQVHETARLANYAETQARATKVLSDLALMTQKREDLKLAYSVKPNFASGPTGYDAAAMGYHITLKNEGEPAEGIWCFCERYVTEFSAKRLARGEWGHLLIEASRVAELPILFSMRCRDSLDYVYHMNFSITEYSESEDRVTVERQGHRVFKLIPFEELVDGDCASAGASISATSRRQCTRDAGLGDDDAYRLAIIELLPSGRCRGVSHRCHATTARHPHLADDHLVALAERVGSVIAEAIALGRSASGG